MCVFVWHCVRACMLEFNLLHDGGDMKGKDLLILLSVRDIEFRQWRHSGNAGGKAPAGLVTVAVCCLRGGALVLLRLRVVI